LSFIAFDLDGTLLDQDKNCPQKLVKIIDKLTELSVGVFIISGRPWSSVAKVVKRIFTGNVYIGGYNGCLVTAPGTDDIVFERYFDDDTVMSLLSLPLPDGISRIIYSDDLTVSDTMNSMLERYIRILDHPIEHISFDDWRTFLGRRWRIFTYRFEPKVAEEFVGYCREKLVGRVRIFHTFPTMVEIIPLDGGKEVACEELRGMLGVSSGDTYAIGDNYNDLEMVKWAAYGGWVGNMNVDVDPGIGLKAKGLYGEGVLELLEKWGFNPHPFD
jgi:hydroxymethylpyrimidine pyrophosphatase-like HAD family hydrolase